MSSSLVLILLVTSTTSTSSTSTTSITVVGPEKPWSWADERAGNTILGRFVSEGNTEQVSSVVDPVLGSVATQLSEPHSQPQNDNVLQGFFVQEGHSEDLGEEPSEDTEYREYDSEQQLLTGQEAELTNFVEEHQYDYQDQIALPQTNQVVLPHPPPPHVVPQLHPPQHHHVQHQHQQRHHPQHQKGKTSST